MDARFQNFRTKMQNVKDLYQSRHYTQCAKFAEQLLAMTNEKQIHPIHLTYLHFYTALSHDTLAREATLKNRHKELKLAEKHYLAAIAALTPPPATKEFEEDERIDSPTSPTFHASYLWKRRSSNAGSFDSTASIASSATSYGSGRDNDEREDWHKRGESFQFPKPPGANNDVNRETQTTSHYNTIYISSYDTPSPHGPSQTPPEYQDDVQTPNHQPNPLASQTSSFLILLHQHVTSVRSLKQKTSVHAVRFAFPSPKLSSSPAMAAASREPARANRVCDDAAEAENKRHMRRKMVFRPRFDPESVRRLCADVLAELA
ncbi:hypothetical protein J1614_002699 [Plenodomus biglobosus]|nr:hypothetical protein J1614_002699 [Plenodomus biglobosus]